jgi:hypothetical protein
MSGVEARNKIETSVRRELFGPASTDEPLGKPLDCSGGVISFASSEEAKGVFYDGGTYQEILSHTDPLHRYGVGVLYPGGVIGSSSNNSDDNRGELIDEETPIPGLSTQEDEISIHEDERSNPPISDANLCNSVADSDDFDLSDANQFKPSAMAISFKVRIEKGGSFKIFVEGAYYDKLTVQVAGYKQSLNWWVRRPFQLEGSINYDALRNERCLTDIVLTPMEGAICPRICPKAQVFARFVPGEFSDVSRLLTVSICNVTTGHGSESSLFQMHFSVDAANGNTIEPYPEDGRVNKDDEEQSIDLLYRKRLTFAIGHGCAATWNNGDESASKTVRCVQADPMPSHETPSLTPDIFVPGTRQRVMVSMRELAIGSRDGNQQIEQILGLYGNWIEERQTEAETLPDQYKSAAQRHVNQCREALNRMRMGWSMIVEYPDSIAARAFRWMNEAMLYQQIRSRLELRKATPDADGILRYREVCSDIAGLESIEIDRGVGNWRPFQIAFILAAMPELIDRASPNRQIVDLIFFPTGGGKTEAYLGASALSLLARRLRNPDDEGTDTLMRYTLRLLTTQQFQRAATLICVLEDIRSKNVKILGSKSFGIGVWLGGDSTPNTWKQAQVSMKKLQHDSREENKFLLLRCPWCGAQMGPQKRTNQPRNNVIGYTLVGRKVLFNCIDPQCRYSGRNYLPIHVVDEDIYETRPSIIIGTVDKFAMLAWKPKARNLFGIGPDGQRLFSPPGLIIQDELHLISGPLGSMVGLYEPIIDDLCTDKRGMVSVPPKIIASTATARRYEEQILTLFGRKEGSVRIFPPNGLEEGHSFFAEPQTLDNGELAPGRKYLGIFSASLGSTQTVQVRVAAATLQAAQDIPKEDRDGYWTNLNFFNSLRELGNTVTLLQSDVPDYLTGLRHRDGLTNPRWPKITMELTSRLRNDEIPRSIEQLQRKYDSKNCVDICLASNIIEVGIDIDRLGLMTIVGQPKTTAQYIQVSGRIGRRPDVSPGLVIMIYGAAKPRDRSHFERFQTYHQQLYAQVEPTSVTPFASPVLKRALPAAIVSHIRQTTEQTLEPWPFPEEAFDDAVQILRSRAELVDSSEMDGFTYEVDRRKKNWQNWERTVWSATTFGDGNPAQGLMQFAGTPPAQETKSLTWDVPTSMRSVDAECSLQVSTAYALEDGDSDVQVEEGK